jgi:hypothetical protein
LLAWRTLPWVNMPSHSCLLLKAYSGLRVLSKLRHDCKTSVSRHGCVGVPQLWHWYKKGNVISISYSIRHRLYCSLPRTCSTLLLLSAHLLSSIDPIHRFYPLLTKWLFSLLYSLPRSPSPGQNNSSTQTVRWERRVSRLPTPSPRLRCS